MQLQACMLHMAATTFHLTQEGEEEELSPYSVSGLRSMIIVSDGDGVL